MKKKNYKTPMMEVIDLKPMTLLQTSGVVNPELDLEYGGIDEFGVIEPS